MRPKLENLGSGRYRIHSAGQVLGHCGKIHKDRWAYWHPPFGKDTAPCGFTRTRSEAVSIITDLAPETRRSTQEVLGKPPKTFQIASIPAKTRRNQ